MTEITLRALGQLFGTRMPLLVWSLRVHEHVNTWPLQGTEPADRLPRPVVRLLWAGWRMETCWRRWSIRPWITGGWPGSTAWTADITCRSWPTGRCTARGMRGTFTVRLQHTAHFTSRSGLRHGAFISSTAAVLGSKNRKTNALKTWRQGDYHQEGRCGGGRGAISSPLREVRWRWSLLFTERIYMRNNAKLCTPLLVDRDWKLH